MKGTIELRRRFRGIGELRLASGTRDKKQAAKMDAMLLTLADAGRYDLLRSLKERRLTPMEVWERFRVGQLDRLPSAAAMRRLAPAWTKWAKGLKASDGHRRDVRLYGERLTGLAGKQATLQELPRTLRKYRVICEEAAHPVSFNRSRAAVQAFLRDTVTRNDDVYREIQAIETLPAGPRRVQGGQSPEGAVAIAERLPTDPAILWLTMCLTGMGPGELDGKWRPEGDGLRIHGTKREGRDRLIPLVREIPRLSCRAQVCRKALRKSGAGVAPYDGRRTFAHWMELAGIERTRRRLYMGHKATDILDLYEGHDVARFLVEDANRLRAIIGPVLAKLTELLTDSGDGR